MPRSKRPQRERTHDWQRIQQYTLWPEQKVYEMLRPVVLFNESAVERPERPRLPEQTLQRKAEQFELHGMASLFPKEPTRLSGKRTFSRSRFCCKGVSKMSEDLFENKSKNADIEQAFEDLHSSDPNKRSSAVEMLSTAPLPAIAATSLPILLAALDDKNARVRKAVTTALGLKGDATAIPRILDLLREKWVRNTAIRTLGQFGLPALLPTVKSSTRQRCYSAKRCCNNIGNDRRHHSHS